MNPEPTNAVTVEGEVGRPAQEAVGDARPFVPGSPGRCSTVSESDSVDGTAEQESPAAFGPRMLQNVKPPCIPGGASGMTVLVERPTGHPVIPPQRHWGLCFGNDELVTWAHLRAPQDDPRVRYGKAGNG